MLASIPSRMRGAALSFPGVNRPGFSESCQNSSIKVTSGSIDHTDNDSWNSIRSLWQQCSTWHINLVPHSSSGFTGGKTKGCIHDKNHSPPAFSFDHQHSQFAHLLQTVLEPQYHIGHST